VWLRERQSKEPLAKSPVRQRGDCSSAAYNPEWLTGFENPLCGSVGIFQVQPWKLDESFRLELGQLPRRKAGLELSPRCRTGDLQEAQKD
jgi:hypothetical protein